MRPVLTAGAEAIENKTIRSLTTLSIASNSGFLMDGFCESIVHGNLILVEASVALWNNTEGLCGNLDGREETDFLSKDGNVVLTPSALASSWQLNKIGETCESSPTSMSACKQQKDEIVVKSQEFCVSLLNKKKFQKCSNVMDARPLLEACQWDYCACAANQNPEDCACNTIAVYAQECLKTGVEEVKMWRDEDTCRNRGGFKLRSKIIGDPTFNCKLCGGMPGKSSEFKTLWENLLLRCRRKLYQ
ncbi:von Willebrand factor [Eumeta japonica]|uniref:von Willebrand factor n=1 Tax=Eumeta variegata TaxID=151549 RepID=A0A4C1Z6E7_EUMVA|nr:von Willebrand factor [Eumeta japonica]